jgi:bacteriorhodopsin
VQGAVGDLFTKKSISVFVTDLVRYFLSFVTIIAVVYVLWAGFQLMVSGGDEESAKKARKIITYVIAGIVLMWLAYWIVTLIIWVLQ